MKKGGIFPWVIAMFSEMVCNFGIQHYKEILKTGIDSGYKFIGFEELETLSSGEKACILRHDVDYMPGWSTFFADIENELGIKSTFFFQVCAKTYNLRESANYLLVRQLVKMGHTVGLHLDLGWKTDMEWQEIVQRCKEDKEVFEAITGVKPYDIISFHNPHRFVNFVLDKDIPGFRHTYEKAFFSAIKYISDSQGWYEGCLCQLFSSGKYEVFQFLSHSYIWPELTTGDFISDMARMVKCCSDDLVQYLIDYHPVCKKNEARLRREVREIQSGLKDQR